MGYDLCDFRTSRLPDDDDRSFGWNIVRAGIDSTLKLVSLSSDIFGIRTHFFRGRTGPCKAVACEACECNHLSRWKGYILAVNSITEQQLIFEFTPPAAKPLDEARKKFGTLRGVQMYVSRSSKKPNAKVIVAVKGMIGLPEKACPDFAVWPILANIWGLTEKAQFKQGGHQLEDLSDFEKAA